MTEKQIMRRTTSLLLYYLHPLLVRINSAFIIPSITPAIKTSRLAKNIQRNSFISTRTTTTAAAKLPFSFLASSPRFIRTKKLPFIFLSSFPDPNSSGKNSFTTSIKPITTAMSMSVEMAPTSIISTNDDKAQCEEVLCSMIAGDEKEPSPTTTPEFIPTKPGQQQKEKTTNGKKRFSTAARISSHKLYAASMNSQPLNWSSIFPDLGKDAVQPTDASALLKSLPRGAYTTCRTIGKGTQIYQFDYHVERLVTSAQAMIESGIVDKENEDYTQVTDLEKVRKSVMSSIKTTIQQFREEFGDDMLPCDEFRITLLTTWLPPEDSIEKENEKNNCNMYCHVTILPYRDTQNSHIKVEIHGHGRSNAIAKDSKWISQREDSKEHNCEEYILVNDEGEMLEGTQTNFYVVVKNREKNGDGIGGVVVTAEEGILKGSVRDSVLRVCEQHGIPVKLRPPKLSDLEHATGAFLSSTSRLVMPIHEAVVNVSEKDIDGGDGSGEGSDGYGSGEELLEAMGQSYHFPDCKLTQRIQRLVAEDVLTHCVSIE